MEVQGLYLYKISLYARVHTRDPRTEHIPKHKGSTCQWASSHVKRWQPTRPQEMNQSHSYICLYNICSQPIIGTFKRLMCRLTDQFWSICLFFSFWAPLATTRECAQAHLLESRLRLWLDSWAGNHHVYIYITHNKVTYYNYMLVGPEVTTTFVPTRCQRLVPALTRVIVISRRNTHF